MPCIRLNGLIVNVIVIVFVARAIISQVIILTYTRTTTTTNDENSNNTIELAPARPHAVAFDCELTAKASLRCHPQKSFE